MVNQMTIPDSDIPFNDMDDMEVIAGERLQLEIDEVISVNPDDDVIDKITMPDTVYRAVWDLREVPEVRDAFLRAPTVLSAEQSGNSEVECFRSL